MVDATPTESLVTGEPESGEATDEPESEIEAELTDTPDLALEGDQGESDGAQQPIDCFTGIQSVDQFFAELGTLDTDTPIQLGPFQFVGSDLLFWASTNNSFA